ncbi:hypothetical protein [Methanothrix sp.]|uniref:COG1361 S-layer family protein n=1 Tax=Methanothrix sp. TaxID=90426 RepID=UPI003297AA02
MELLKIICILLILFGLGQAEDIIFFADDHYKSLSDILLNASATNPALSPGDNVLRISIANQGRIEELIPISSSDSPDDILQEQREEMKSSVAMEIRAALQSTGPIQVTSGPQHIALLPAGESGELEFNISIDRRANGWYDLPLQVDYVRQVDVSISDGEAFPLRQPSNQSLNLRIYAFGDKDDLRIAGVQSQLHRGGEGSLIIAVENIGEDIFPNCSASLIAAPPFRVKSTDHPLGDLSPGEMASASFLVEVDGDAAWEEYQLGLGLRSKKMDLVLPFELSLKGSGRLISHGAILFIALLALLVLLAIILRRQKLLYGRKRRIKRL